jgi:hypothetical protein
MKRKNYVGIVDSSDNEQLPVYCPFCLKFDSKVLLGPKAILQGEQPTPNHDKYLQCYQCGEIIPIYEAKYEQTLEGFAEPSDNPFDTGEEVLGIPKKNFTSRPQSNKER